MIESTMRTTLVRLLKPLGAFAVENGGAHPGTPDIACTLGWIECKSTESWPVNPDTPVQLNHPLTQQQRIWQIKWAAAGGRGWVMLNVGREWLLLRGIVAATILGGAEAATRAELMVENVAWWNGTPSTESLVDALYEE